MEILLHEISQMNTSNNDYELNNSNNNQNDEYTYAITDTADLGNMYGNFGIPNISNLYIK